MNFHISTLFIKQHCIPRPPLTAFVRLGEFPYAYGHLCIEPFVKSCFGSCVLCIQPGLGFIPLPLSVTIL